MDQLRRLQIERTLSIQTCFPERNSAPDSAKSTHDNYDNVFASDTSNSNTVQNGLLLSSVNASPKMTSILGRSPQTTRFGSIKPKNRAVYVPLYQAALVGDWEKAREFITLHPHAITARITKGMETALHIAAGAKQTKFVEELVNLMEPSDMILQSKYDNTALCFAAASGITEIADIMVTKNKNLPMVRGSKGILPLHMAALLGHREMTWFLYSVTSEDVFTKEDYIGLLIAVISSDLFDIALRILKDNPAIATERAPNGETALNVLARKQACFSGKCRLGFWRRFVNSSNGNFGFIAELLSSCPDLIWKVDEESQSIFHVAVIHRQEKIFRILYDIGALKDLITSYKTSDDRNMLHLAAKLAPADRLGIVSGAALQMQRELLWFKEVEKIVQPLYKEMQNSEGLTPRALFSQEHKKLTKEGERWMKDTASSCMLVATLITTVMFGAILTVPGGNNNDNGIPIFQQKKPFIIFSISDAIALLSSVTSILMFLSILTSRYAEDNFLESLPKKLIIGLTTLFFSIVAMLIAFTASFFIVMGHHLAWIIIPVGLCACITVAIFALFQFPLLSDTVRTTYLSGIFSGGHTVNIFQ